MVDPGLERHTSLPYLWYSGSISEEQFMRTAHVYLKDYNEHFYLDEREETRFVDAKKHLSFTLSDLQTLG